jgi:PST family polysaccharide transporter
LQALALTFVLSGLGSIHESRLKKSMQFKQLFAAEMGRTIVKGGLSILLALLGFGVWSLVIGQLAGTLAATIILWIALPWRPRFGTSIFDWEIARSLSGYGSQLILVDLLGMVHKNIDYLIVGRRMDSTQLGYYSMAFRIPELVIISTVMLSMGFVPGLCHLRKDMQALRKGS